MTEPIRAGAVVYARNLRDMAAFYAGLTALPVLVSEPEHVVLGANGFELTIVQAPLEFAGPAERKSRPVRRTEAPLKLIFAVASIAASRSVAPSLGGEIDAVEHEWSLHEHLVCDGHDPEGNVIQLREHINKSAEG